MGTNLLKLAEHLRVLEDKCGRRIVLAVEPEPGCSFETIDEWIHFFENHLLLGRPKLEESVRRHIGTCFDVCHQSIQYEDPQQAIGQLIGAGIEIAKVQLSSALEIDRPWENDPALRQLSDFAEDRYLHQVVAQTDSGETQYFGDLPDYLDVATTRRDRSARIHFHVPIFCKTIDHLNTTQADLKTVLSEVLSTQVCSHLEIETYSWGVMPERRDRTPDEQDMQDDIVAEYQWVVDHVASD